MPNRRLSEELFFPNISEQQTNYPKKWILRVDDQIDGAKQYKWSCLKCGFANFSNSENTTDLAAEAHYYECRGNVELAMQRHDLIQAIILCDHIRFIEPQLTHHFGIGLLQRGGLWKKLADELGWPKGYCAENGWYLDYAEAFKQCGLSSTYSNEFMSITNKEQENYE